MQENTAVNDFSDSRQLRAQALLDIKPFESYLLRFHHPYAYIPIFGTFDQSVLFYSLNHQTGHQSLQLQSYPDI